MARIEKPKPLVLPSFKIKEIVPTLEKNGRVYSQSILGCDRDGRVFKMKERRGLPLEDFKNIPLECVVEITKARFFDESNEEKRANECLKAVFIGWETGYKFFSELVSMIEGETGDPDQDEDFDEDKYMELSDHLFSNWGIAGFGLEPNRDKPMIKTQNGTFFLNEFIFEDYIDKWEQNILPDVPFYIIIDELLLHGIKESEKRWDAKNKKEITAGPNEMLIHGGWSVLDPF